jgi:hypothetical protein
MMAKLVLDVSTIQSSRLFKQQVLMELCASQSLGAEVGSTSSELWKNFFIHNSYFVIHNSAFQPCEMLDSMEQD